MNASLTFRRISSVLSAATATAALLVCVAATEASNIAGTGTGFIGATSNPALTGVENDHAGGAGNINDNNLGTHVDNFDQPGNALNANSYVGISFASPVNNVDAVTLTMSMFGDGGWFGPGGTLNNPLLVGDLPRLRRCKLLPTEPTGPMCLP